MDIKLTRQISIQIILVISVAALLSQCEDDQIRQLKAAKKISERRIRDYTAETRRLKEELEAIQPEAAPAESVESGIAAAIEAKRVAWNLIDQLEPMIRTESALLLAYQKAFRVRNPFRKAEKLGNFRLRNGNEIEDAIVTEVRSDRLGVRHKKGIAYFDANDLPGEFQERFTPEIERLPFDVDSLLAKKPDSLKSMDQVRKERDQAAEVQRKQYANEIELKRARNQVQSDQYRAKSATALAESAAKNRRRSAILSKIGSLNESIIVQKNALASLESQWSFNTNIKPSMSDQQRTLDSYNQKIAALRSQIEALKIQLNGL